MVSGQTLFMMNCAIGIFFLARKYSFVAALFFIFSSFVRETGTFIILSILIWGILSRNFSKRETLYFIFALVLATCSSFYAKEIFNCSGSMLGTIFGWAYRRLSDFKEIERFVAAVFMTTAPFLVCMSSNIISSENSTPNLSVNSITVPLQQMKWLGFLMLVLSALMAFFGGSDSTRIFYQTYPLFFIFLATLMKINIFSIFYFSCVVSFINSFPKKIPEPVEYWPNNDISGLFSL